jgi:hypothetical protein
MAPFIEIASGPSQASKSCAEKILQKSSRIRSVRRIYIGREIDFSLVHQLGRRPHAGR